MWQILNEKIERLHTGTHLLIHVLGHFLSAYPFLNNPP
jgi:hypothetical protein